MWTFSLSSNLSGHRHVVTDKGVDFARLLMKRALIVGLLTLHCQLTPGDYHAGLEW